MTSKTAGQIINSMPPGVFTTLCKIRPAGGLQARKQATGAIAFYWRYSIGPASERVSIGLYDPAAPPKSLLPTKVGHSVAAATRAAEALALEHHQNRAEGGRPALVQKQREAVNAAVEVKRLAAVSTLENLLLAYCDYLKTIGRQSHGNARSIFKLHVIEAHPKIASLPAKDVTGEQFADMMRSLVEVGKGRTANKLRSYARAAYQVAKASRSKASIPVSFKEYGIATNPVAETEPDDSQNRADKNPLLGAQLRDYWQIIKPLPGIKGALLRLHLLTGGQRIEQLVALRTNGIHPEWFQLFDGKGRPGKEARLHAVPLIKAAVMALEVCGPSGEFALSTDGGTTHVAATTLSRWAVDAARGAVGDFQAKRIRSGIETLLASVGVSQDIRGRLQSHGIGGVQARHYDAHDYLPEKRKALETLFNLLERDAPNTSV